MRENITFETAKKIRDLLDAARTEYGPKEWEENDCESTILSLVTDDA